MVVVLISTEKLCQRVQLEELFFLFIVKRFMLVCLRGNCQKVACKVKLQSFRLLPNLNSRLVPVTLLHCTVYEYFLRDIFFYEIYCCRIQKNGSAIVVCYVIFF